MFEKIPITDTTEVEFTTHRVSRLASRVKQELINKLDIYNIKEGKLLSIIYYYQNSFVPTYFCVATRCNSHDGDSHNNSVVVVFGGGCSCGGGLGFVAILSHNCNSDVGICDRCSRYYPSPTSSKPSNNHNTTTIANDKYE